MSAESGTADVSSTVTTHHDAAAPGAGIGGRVGSHAPAAAPSSAQPRPLPAATGVPRRGRSGTMHRLFASELALIFRRRRNLAGLGVLAVVPIIIAVAVKVSSGGPRGADFFADIAGNGMFVALAALTVEMPLFLPLAVAAIAGDSVAGEANVGSLRFLLTAPVGRSRLLAVKYAAVAVFSLAATALVAVVGAIVGLALFPGSRMTMLSGQQVSLLDGLGRTGLAVVYLSIGFAALGAIGLFISTLTEQPIGAMIAIVLLNVGMFIADAIPQLSWLAPWLLTHWWTSFADLFRTPILWDNVARGTITALVYLAIGYACAWARFGSKDVTS
jgi:ABC-2 type transport system permease protein